ncbi:sec-independent protein translocase protein TatB [Rhodoblastus acidophilus]|uniref:Sec-independent protein translocase protein TatB n=1 Tax=Rhodoblastus acidophilus TaxID=1074 RepID=A0A212REI3_RHOAC|nr:Sec-independent protein translocase protein TatB [Rhodoblastus acidophilus]MCW2316792.1 sec-independent protein translocase protein TatB [Rhodoblastus acidophilus]PPQ39719.1 twin-arginine translocase subunit TatB [Rhodoblastus acidophilus]RAI16798.1 twin-arginine translocase subunit TatB [Rhodoblastus acidophilus]SNB70748.1 sec-independent protein translocase protein TatB [Rhodoblastus acidophilus]
MFDFDVGKLLLIGVVALIFIPPKDLPSALRQFGRMLGQARRMASDFRAQFDEAMREADMRDLKDEFSDLKQKASIEGTMNRIADMIDPEKAKSVEASPAVAPEPAPAPEPTPILEPAEKPMIESAELPPHPTEAKS